MLGQTFETAECDKRWASMEDEVMNITFSTDICNINRILSLNLNKFTRNTSLMYTYKFQVFIFKLYLSIATYESLG